MITTEKENFVREVFSNIDNFVKILSTHGEGFLFTNENGVIHYMNKAAKDIFGAGEKEFTNKNLFKLLADENKVNEQREIKSLLKNSENRKLRLTFKKLNDSVFSADVNFNSLISTNGKIFCCVIRRCSDEQMEIEKLKQEKEEALNLAQTKTEYLAQLSHEIRTPLNLMMNFTSLIREVLETETRKSLKQEFAIISNAGKRIVRTIDLVLNMSEIQSGKFEIYKTKFDLYEEIISRIGKDFQNYAKEKKLKFSVKSNVENSKIFADEYSVFQAVMNIVDNAFKYTEKGKVEIKLSRDRRGRLYILVSDTGIGMSEEYQKDLFKPFHQEDTGFAGKIKGNGLGLSLVKKYCELNDMTIEVDSKKNVGTKIKLIFPN